MSELIKTRCSQGKLIITETHIIVELGRLKSTMLVREAFTGMDMKLAMFPIPFIYDGASNLLFHGRGGERLKATMVKTKKAKEIRALLTGR
jgi:hypothetical protein